jgi:hypothetical protein
MAAARTVHKGIYESDILGPGTTFTRRVDDHLYTQAVLGWTAPVGGEVPLPTTMRPRHASGLDASGRRHSVVCATTACDIWTRTSAQWNILDDTGALVATTVTGLIGEAVTF